MIMIDWSDSITYFVMIPGAIAFLLGGVVRYMRNKYYVSDGIDKLTGWERERYIGENKYIPRIYNAIRMVIVWLVVLILFYAFFLQYPLESERMTKQMLERAKTKEE